MPALPAAAVPVGDAWSDPANPVTQRFHGKRLDLWSLKAPALPPVPEVKSSPSVRNEVDRFIVPRLEHQGVQPIPEASRRTLIRRVTFGLTGLPPSPEETEAFEKDTAPDAWERLVDRLLASREYAEHQARWWLDVVRYSDSNGFDYDEFRPEAWRFRDYVVRAFAADKPYDRFMQEQLAGDELVNGAPRGAADQDALTAAGFLRIGPYDNSAVKFGEEDRCRAQVMSDVVETTGAAFLGLNLSCCRCHDHKTDPFLQQDYYRLRAVFEGIKPDDHAVLDQEPAYSKIRQEEQQLEALKAAVTAVQEGVIQRVQAAKLLTLPLEDQAIWSDPAKRREASNKKKIREIRRAIKPDDNEIAAAFSVGEKEAKTQAEAAVKTFEAKRTPRQPVFTVKDKTGPLPETPVLHQGDFMEPRDPVPPGVPSVLDPNPLPPKPAVRQGSSGRRLALAAWLASPENPWTARVLVNRIWLTHFGRGLVPTPNDFGFAGERPGHPELLDWLAVRFREDGWSIRKMHRLILLSATYRQGLAHDPDAAAAFAGHLPRRVSAEAVRDAMLKVSGLLQTCEGGPPRWPALSVEVMGTNPGVLIENEEHTRGWYPSPPEALNVRSLYLIQKRSLRVPMLEIFDLPESLQSCGARAISTVAPQALTLMNGEFTSQMSEAFARRLQAPDRSPEEIVRQAYVLALQRPPEAEELETCQAFLATHTLPEFCRVLFNLDEFIYTD